MSNIDVPAGHPFSPRRHTVRLHGVVVGYSELEDIEPSVGRARGRFRPGVGYELVQPVFRLFSEAVPEPNGPVTDAEKLERYYRSRDALGLSLEDDAGRVIRTTTIHIADYSDRKNGNIDVDILISDPAYWHSRMRTE